MNSSDPFQKASLGLVTEGLTKRALFNNVCFKIDEVLLRAEAKGLIDGFQSVAVPYEQYDDDNGKRRVRYEIAGRNIAGRRSEESKRTFDFLLIAENIPARFMASGWHLERRLQPENFVRLRMSPVGSDKLALQAQREMLYHTPIRSRGERKGTLISKPEHAALYLERVENFLAFSADKFDPKPQNVIGFMPK